MIKLFEGKTATQYELVDLNFYHCIPHLSIDDFHLNRPAIGQHHIRYGIVNPESSRMPTTNNINNSTITDIGGNQYNFGSADPQSMLLFLTCFFVQN